MDPKHDGGDFGIMVSRSRQIRRKDLKNLVNKRGNFAYKPVCSMHLPHSESLVKKSPLVRYPLLPLRKTPSEFLVLFQVEGRPWGGSSSKNRFCRPSVNSAKNL